MDVHVPPRQAGPPVAAEILRARGLGKRYMAGDMPVNALQDVDFTLHAGEMVVLLGPSGSGKSTLLNLLGGLDRATHGVLTFRAQDLTRADEVALTRFRRLHVGFIFQFYNLIPSLTALENVALVADLAAHPMTPLEALDRVGLAARRDHFPAQLSGGEQQRVAIARAVVKRPEILLCDEPTGALDAATGRLVLGVLDDIHRELGAATAVVTHNAAIARMADRTVSLRDGRVLSDVVTVNRQHAQDIDW